MLMKREQKKIPPAIHIAPSLFAKNLTVNFQARSKVGMLKKQTNKTSEIETETKATEFLRRKFKVIAFLIETF